MNAQLNAYQHTQLQGQLEEASPHRLIQLLLEGCVQRIVWAREAMEVGHVERKVEMVQKALAILDGLSASLDMEQGEIARNLDELYAYMKQRLVDGNRGNRPEAFEEVISLLNEIRLAWDAIPMVMRADSQSTEPAAQTVHVQG